MDATKPWYLSRTILGGIVVVASLIAAAFNYKVDDATQSVVIDELEALVSAVGIAVGGALTIYGRVKAALQISTPNNP